MSTDLTNYFQAFRAILVLGALLLTLALTLTSKATNALILTTVSWTAKSAVSTAKTDLDLVANLFEY